MNYKEFNLNNSPFFTTNISKEKYIKKQGAKFASF